MHARDRNVDVINVNLAVSQNTLARFSNRRSASFGLNCARNCDSKYVCSLCMYYIGLGNINMSRLICIYQSVNL